MLNILVSPTGLAEEQRSLHGCLNAVMLAVMLWFHLTFPYGDNVLTDSGVAFMNSGDTGYFTPAGAAKLADGGRMFLAQVQQGISFCPCMAEGLAVPFANFPIDADTQSSNPHQGHTP